MSIPSDMTFLLVPRSRSSVKDKVKYQCRSFQKMGVADSLVFHKPGLFVTITSLLNDNVVPVPNLTGYADNK